MTATTTREAAHAAPVGVRVDDTLTACLENMQRLALDAQRQDAEFLRALAPARGWRNPLQALGRRIAGNAIAETVKAAQAVTARQVSEITDMLEGLRSSTTAVISEGRARDLTRLDREARRISRGHAAVGVQIARLLSRLLEEDREVTAASAALALRGDTRHRRDWHTLAAEGMPEAVALVGLLADLDALDAATEALAAEVAALVVAVSLSGFPEPAEPIPPPRRTLAGSLDLHAPPVAACSATAGRVLPAERSPMP